MYSWEIEQLLKLKNYLLECEEYNHLVTTSPQINKVKYEHNDFTVETNDDYKFKFKIKTRK